MTWWYQVSPEESEADEREFWARIWAQGEKQPEAKPKMRIHLEPTEQIVQIFGSIIPGNRATAIAGRVWKGTTENGVEIQAVIVRTAIPALALGEADRLAKELVETPAPRPEPAAFPDRFTV